MMMMMNDNVDIVDSIVMNNDDDALAKINDYRDVMERECDDVG